MSRNRKSAKKAGAGFEKLVADYLRLVTGDDRIERRVTNGAKDRGDVGGVRFLGGRVVVECKDYGGVLKTSWLGEAEVERGNDDAVIGVVVAKRRGTTLPEDQVVMMSLETFGKIVGGS